MTATARTRLALVHVARHPLQPAPRRVAAPARPAPADADAAGRAGAASRHGPMCLCAARGAFAFAVD